MHTSEPVHEIRAELKYLRVTFDSVSQIQIYSY